MGIVWERCAGMSIYDAMVVVLLAITCGVGAREPYSSINHDHVVVGGCDC